MMKILELPVSNEARQYELDQNVLRSCAAYKALLLRAGLVKTD
jgi:hypothetical protein